MDIKVLSAKVALTLADTTSLMVSAQRVNTRARTVYYKCAVILMASILELILFDFVEAHCNHDPKLLGTPKWRYDPLQPLVKVKLGTDKNLFIAEKIKELDSLDKIRRDFNSMIEFCHTKKLVSNGLYKKLRYAKDRRNDVHLQKTNYANRNFNKKMVLRIANTTKALMKKRVELARLQT